jgi:hypothetical protein
VVEEAEDGEIGHEAEESIKAEAADLIVAISLGS